ncbi:MAG: DUF389 domain-containing protein [Anaerolineae bacterium]|nr:DUF389 domain-containing protein [Anaerolineae bacterium]
MDRADGHLMVGLRPAETVAAGAGLGLALLAVWGGSLGPEPLLQAILAALLAGCFLILALLNSFELLAGSADPTGGAHVLVHEVAQGIVGFMTGWWAATAGLVLVALLSYLAGAHAAALLSPWVSLEPRWTGLALLMGVLVLHLLAGEVRPAWLWLAVPLLVGLFAVGLVRWVPAPAGLAPGPLPPLGAWLALTYAPLELTLSSRRWIRAPLVAEASGRLWRQLVSAQLAALAVPLLGSVLLLPSLGRAEAAEPALRLARLVGPTAAPAVGVAMVLVALLLGLDAAVRLFGHGIRTLARLGGLPIALNRTWRRSGHPWPPLLAAVVGAGALVWALPPGWLEAVARLAWLIPPLALSATAAYSRQVERERRRLFRLPFHPMVPGLALVLGLVLLIGLPQQSWLGGAIWSAAGALVYVAYARRHQAAAQVGASVFTGPGLPEKAEGGFRVLVPLRSASSREREQVFPLALRLAEATGGDVLLLRVIAVPDPLAVEESRRMAQEQDELFRWAVAAGEASETVHSVTRLARSRPEGILDTAVEADCDLILISADVSEQRMPLRRVVDPVTRWATRNVAVLMRKEGEATEIEPIRRILVPTRGGSHVALAAQLALLLASSSGAEVTVLNVADIQASAEELAEAEEVLTRTLERFSAQAEALEAEVVVRGEVVQGDRPARRIAEESAGYDLVIMGASEMGLLDRVLFGTVPEDVARMSATPVLVVRRYLGLPRFWLRRLWEAVYNAVPELDAEQQVEVYRQIRRGARSRADFFIMIGLASLIATFGLQQNNPAVIIGAMLVAPFFAPVVALGLGIAHADVRLLRVALESTLKGVFLSVALSFLLSAAVPLRTVTAEMTSRTQPGLLDLGVALAAGAAGAYAVSRKEVSASLPGVAIAAALVPPLSVIGVGMAWGQWRLAGGAALLFGTNLVAITLAGALLMLMVGFRPAPRREGQERLRIGLVLVLLSLLLVAAPLAVLSARSLQVFQARRQVEAVLTERLAGGPGLRLMAVSVEEGAGGLEVMATVASTGGVSSEQVADLERELEAETGRPVRLGVVVWPLVQGAEH